MADPKEILLEIENEIGWITISNPSRANAMSREMALSLMDAWKKLDDDESVKVIAITGAGERHFCAGTDLEVLSKFAGVVDAKDSKAGRGVTSIACEVSKPVIAVVNGPAVGMALGIVADADVVIASKNASFFDPHVQIGRVVGGTLSLTTKLPIPTVIAIGLGTTRLTATRAHELGFVDLLVDQSSDLHDAVVEYVKPILAASPTALRESLKLMRMVASSPHVEEVRRLGRDRIKALGDHPDATEGPKSRLEGRAPKLGAGRGLINRSLIDNIKGEANVNLSFTAEQEAWRGEVREFLDREMRPEFAESCEWREDQEYWDFALEFTRRVGARGWIGLTWPTDYGGLARPVIDRYILAEEFSLAEAPLVNSGGWMLAANALLAVGTEAQKQRFLPPIAKMEEFWVEGYTEPDAGSDLASLTTWGRREGDSWVINGQKTYTTWGERGDFIYLAVRTNREAPRHQGISIFAVDMKLPGIHVTPLMNLGGGRQNHTFFEEVRIPTDMMFGDEGQGWSIIMQDRFGGDRVAGGAGYMSGQRQLKQLTQYCRTATRNGRPLIEDSVVRNLLAEYVLIVESERMLAYEALSAALSRQRQPYAGSIGQVVTKESTPRLAEIRNEIMGPFVQLTKDSRWAPIEGKFEAAYRRSFGTHAGGTPQVKRMVLATRGLGLPRR